MTSMNRMGRGTAFVMRQSRNLTLGLLMLLAWPGTDGRTQAAGPLHPAPPSAGDVPQEEAPGRDPAIARARFLMGSPLTVTLPAPASPDLFEAVFDEVARLEAVLSNWRDDSELSRLNAGAARAPFRCSPDLFEAIVQSIAWAENTGGAFDPTVEPVVRELGLFGDPYDGRAPAADPPAAGTRADWRAVACDREARTVRFASDGMGIDMGGIGKGIALDAAARVLRAAGRSRALIDFGGQVLAVGGPEGGAGWAVAVADPDDRDRTIARLRIRDRSLSTSAPRGRRGPGGAGHIIDPRTGAPASFSGSVTVAAADATGADALSTALCVMGLEAGGAWAGRRDVAALFAWRDATGILRMRSTRAWDRMVDEDGRRPRDPAGAGTEGVDSIGPGGPGRAR
jgi:thiamine biosynthesis lipoprotein